MDEELKKAEELKQAYAALGLPENATREQVEKRYFILLKRSRSGKDVPESAVVGGEGVPSISEINKAYNTVLGIETAKLTDIPKQGKVAHFFFYYRTHVIVSVIVLIFAGFMIKEAVDKRIAESKLPPIDLEVSVFGNYYFADPDLLSANMLKLVPEWQRIETTVTYVPTEIRSEQDMALQQKSVLHLVTENPNLYILDELNFHSLAAQGALRKLEELPDWAALAVPGSKTVKSRSQDDTEEHLYGIDITGNPVFEGVEMSDERQIIALRINNKEDTWDLTRMLVKPLIATTP